ncbi:MAG TPA: cytochrome c-type biogenesis CcmF C-terminal domain-containing protein, partial [Polyangiaceae bacterium]
LVGVILMRHSFNSTMAVAGSAVLFSLLALVAPYFIYTLVTLPHTSRRRYGGLIVHFGLCFMFLGFTGKSWTVDRETTLNPQQTYEVEGYTLKYLGKRSEVDNSKRMIFADVEVQRDGKVLGTLTPAKFIYKKMPESPTTEVSMMHALRDDLYLVVGSVNPQTGVASFQIHVNPLVSWIWFGAIVLIFGSIICMWPELQTSESRVWAAARGVAGVAASITFGIIIAMMPAPAWAQGGGSSSHAGTIHIEDAREKAVFNALRCMCGTCARDLLSTCACETADEARDEIRKKIAAGETNDQIILAYKEEYGVEALAIPPNEGGMKAIYIIPLAGLSVGAVGVIWLIRSWQRTQRVTTVTKSADDAKSKGAKRDDYDDRLDEELRDLDG